MAVIATPMAAGGAHARRLKIHIRRARLNQATPVVRPYANVRHPALVLPQGATYTHVLGPRGKRGNPTKPLLCSWVLGKLPLNLSVGPRPPTPPLSN